MHNHTAQYSSEKASMIKMFILNTYPYLEDFLFFLAITTITITITIHTLMMNTIAMTVPVIAGIEDGFEDNDDPVAADNCITIKITCGNSLNECSCMF